MVILTYPLVHKLLDLEGRFISTEKKKRTTALVSIILKLSDKPDRETPFHFILFVIFIDSFNIRISYQISLV